MTTIELIDKLCKVTTLQNDIIREQTMIIEQHRMIDSFEEKRDTVNDMLDRVEYELRSNL